MASPLPTTSSRVPPPKISPAKGLDVFRDVETWPSLDSEIDLLSGALLGECRKLHHHIMLMRAGLINLPSYNAAVSIEEDFFECMTEYVEVRPSPLGLCPLTHIHTQGWDEWPTFRMRHFDGHQYVYWWNEDDGSLQWRKPADLEFDIEVCYIITSNTFNMININTTTLEW